MSPTRPRRDLRGVRGGCWFSRFGFGHSWLVSRSGKRMK